MKDFRQPILINQNRDWVLSELDKLREEWTDWEKAVAEITDQPYDPRTHGDVYADGESNMRHHDVLQAKTLTFLSNNIEHHGFIEGFDGNDCDRTDLRLNHRVKHRLHALDKLRASLQYAQGIAPVAQPTPAIVVATMPIGFLHHVRCFSQTYWQSAVKWTFGIVAAVVTAYLAKHLAG